MYVADSYREGGRDVDSATIDPVSLVYHELRAPLGLVATAARAAAEDAGDEDLRLRCEMIVRAAERMLRTANEVFQLNRAADSSTRTPFSPWGVTRDIAETLAAFDVCVRAAADKASRALVVEGVPDRFEALVHSLITNAVDHAPPGSPVDVELRLVDSELELVVSNPVASVRRHRGLGLGTVVAEGLASRLGGSLEVAATGELFAAMLRLPIASL
jgi:signal transduction histidine kinase